ncbi:MAG: DNA alkylation repair protein [Chloroflexi bacterium]|nr:DNA alkylation repair protein [Chloroflexota bacterium]
MDPKEAASAARQIIGSYSPADPDPTAVALRGVWLQATPTGIDLARAEQFLGLKTAGTPVPVLKAMGQEIGKAARKRVADFIPLARHLWDNYGREGRLLASAFLGPMELAAPEAVVPLIYQLAQTCLAWEDCDQLAMTTLEPIVRKNPEGYLDCLGPWVSDENKWVRRAAITAIGRLPMKRAEYTARCLELVEPALGDPDLDVKRALSFAIRISARGQVAPVRDFILAHRDAADADSIWVLCDVIRSMTRVFLPQFANLLPVYEAWLKTADARTKRSVESAISTLRKAKG